MYFAGRGQCVQGTEGDDYADLSSKFLRATLIEDLTVAGLRSQNVQRNMVLAQCE